MKGGLQTASRLGVLRPLDIVKRSLRDHFSSMDACARTEVDDMVCSAHRFLVVLDNNERVSLLSQRGQSIEQT